MTMSASKRGNDVFFHLKCEGVEGGGNGFHGDLNPKRSKGDRGKIPISMRERKDKIGEKVATLQQLVSPYGKTDTASVLQEATGYIKFLQEQLKVLCAPYLQNPLVANSDRYSLRSRGLCLMPAAYSLQLAGSNGADIWAPINTRRPKC